MPTVAVIIPYFQRKAGILRRALESVRLQQLPPGVQVHVVVVDDSSPVPAAGELAGLALPPACRLSLVEQSNGGVGAARNTALHQLDNATDYIAFLDSDDIWAPAHLAEALATLERGYDFYFCDTQRQGAVDTAFAAKDFGRFLAGSHARALGQDVFEVAAEPFFDQSLRGRAVQIQAVVYRRAIAPDLTFDTSLRFAGEDCLFLFQLLQRAKSVCCSTHLSVTLADGINIYAGKQGWDNPEQLNLCMGQLLAFYRWVAVLSLSAANRRFMQERITKMRQLFAFLTLRNWFKHRRGWPAGLGALTRQDSAFKRWYPGCLLYVAFGRALSFYDPAQKW